MSYYFINNMSYYLYIEYFTFGHWLSELIVVLGVYSNSLTIIYYEAHKS